ncbi:hypothetical protein BH11PLA2_BH11PLA2_36490 [soil metagenome]
MAKHCPADNYTSEDDFDTACPICGKTLLTDLEKERGWARYVGNPGPGYETQMKLRKVYILVIVLFSTVAIIGWAMMWFKNAP